MLRRLGTAPGPGTVGTLGYSRDPRNSKDFKGQFWDPGDTANPELGAVYTLGTPVSVLLRSQGHFGYFGDTL